MTHTVIGLFNTTDQAKNAFQQLLSNGFVSNNVDMSAQNAASNNSNNTPNRNQDTGDKIGNFFSSLFDDKNEARHYSNAVQNGKSLITVQAKSDDEADRAARLLDQYGALDIDQNEIGANQKTIANAVNPNNTTSPNPQNANAGNSVKVMEEKLEVGKRTEQTGGVRLRSRIVKRPVEAKLRLREEHVTVDRQPVDRKATAADLKNFKQGEVTMKEHAEVPVISKEARVVEEVSLNKEVNQKNKTIHDTVRKTEVEVEQLGARK